MLAVRRASSADGLLSHSASEVVFMRLGWDDHWSRARTVLYRVHVRATEPSRTADREARFCLLCADRQDRQVLRRDPYSQRGTGTGIYDAWFSLYKENVQVRANA